LLYTRATKKIVAITTKRNIFGH